MKFPPQTCDSLSVETSFPSLACATRYSCNKHGLHVARQTVGGGMSGIRFEDIVWHNTPIKHNWRITSLIRVISSSRSALPTLGMKTGDGSPGHLSSPYIKKLLVSMCQRNRQLFHWIVMCVWLKKNSS